MRAAWLWAAGSMVAASMVACGSKSSPAPELVTRNLPGNEQMMPMVSPGEVDDFDGSVAFVEVDGGCCVVQFALTTEPGESVAQLEIDGLTYGMTRTGLNWSVNACIPFGSTTYFFSTGYPADDDAGILWGSRVSEAVTKTAGSLVPEVNIFDIGTATACELFDGHLYGMTSTDAGVETNDAGSLDAGAMESMDAGGTDAGSTADAGNTTPVETAITGACDTMSSGTVVLTSTNQLPDIDELAGAVTEMPFAFSFFGTAVSHFSAASNGYVELFTSSTGTPTVNGQNVAMPNTLAPNGSIAPMWDDLAPALMGTTTLTSQLFGTAGSRHLTLEWNNWAFFFGDGNSRATFQAKIFEGTNAIEFHYCTLSANGDTDQFVQGFGATVGIENASGTVAVQHSFATSVLTTANGVHYE